MAFPQPDSPLVVKSGQAQNQPLLEMRRQIIQRITVEKKFSEIILVIR